MIKHPGGSDSKSSACNAGDLGSIPGSKRSPGEGNGYPFLYSCLENSMDKRSLSGYSPWCHKESDTTKNKHIATLRQSKCYALGVYSRKMKTYLQENLTRESS